MEDNNNIYIERNKSYFPIGLTIEDAREAIKGVTGFRESIRDDTIVFNYDSMTDESFPDPLSEKEDAKKQFLLRCRRECRGLIFDLKSEKLLCRKLHKFFNINEFKETKAENIDLSSEPWILMDKIDGSLISPMINKGSVYWGSKQGVSDLGTMLNQYVGLCCSNIRYNEFSLKWIQLGYTPLFEYSSSKQQIILLYNQESLKCLALRNNHTGEYLKWSELKETCKEFNIPLVDLIDTTSDRSLFKDCKTTEQLVSVVKQMKFIEGVVLKFENSGKMFKIKTDWYITLARLSIHGSKKEIRYEKDVWSLILGGHFDDFKETIKCISNGDPQERGIEKIQLIESFCKQLFDRIDLVSKSIINLILNAKLNNIEKNKFHQFAPTFQNTNSSEFIKLTDGAHKFCYNFWDIIESNHTINQHLSTVSKGVIQRCKDFTNSNLKLENARLLLGKDLKFDFIQPLKK